MHANVIAMDFATRILIVDDDDGIRSLISSFLSKNGFHTETARNPKEMRSLIAARRPDLIVLDVMMPGEDGLSALRTLQNHDAPPVIMLSAVGTDVDKIIGLEIGAEDYLAKPCNPRELLARIRTVLRRRELRTVPGQEALPRAGGLIARNVLRFGAWSLDVDAFTLYDATRRPVPLTDGEFRLLRALVEHPRRVLTRDQLLDFARGADSDNFDRSVDVQISRIRRKLSASGVEEGIIRTVRNEGYMFTALVTQGDA